jgi:hypothetical protein
LFLNRHTYKTTTVSAALCVCLLIAFASCRHHAHKVTPGIYYWKTIYNPTPSELHKLHSIHCAYMHLRLFDVDWDPVARTATPLAPIRLPRHLDTGFHYIPVIFIKQELLLHYRDSSISGLAQHITSMAQGLCEAAAIQPTEVQVDCDWTSSTRDKYFELLQQLRKQDWFRGKTLSVTIRLHQVKYTKSMGIPPADKGLLMCYNMGNIKKYDVRNSIIDPALAEDYLKYLPGYTLPLDVALPLFDWCLLFRNHQFKGILRDVPAAAVKESKLFLKNDYIYTCTQDTVWNGYSLKKGDQLRPEDASYKDVLELSRYTASRIKQDKLNLIFFHCDSLTLAKYSTHELEKILDTYR